MSDSSPLLPTPRRLPWWRQWQIIVPVLFAIVVGLVLGFGLFKVYTVPTAAMEPTIKKGEQIYAERFSFLKRLPKRGDIITFRTDDLLRPGPGEIYVKRVAGEPGEHVRFADGKLYINGAPMSLQNDAGEIVFVAPAEAPMPFTELTVPPKTYFVIGDNTAHSFDSRSFGCVPLDHIIGRVILRK